MGKQDGGSVGVARPSPVSSNGQAEPGETEQRLSEDVIFETLRNQRRRQVIAYLKAEADSSASVKELYGHIAAKENGVTVDETTYAQRKRVYTSLLQTHLPKLDELDVIEYDDDRGTVSLKQASQELSVYLELNQGSDLLWSDYYVGLSMFSCLMAGSLALSVGPFGVIPPLGWFAIASGLFLVSALVHAWQTRRSRLVTENGSFPLGSD